MNGNNNQVTNQNEQTNLMNQYNQQPNMTNMNNMGQYSQSLTMNNLNQDGQPLNSNNGLPVVTNEDGAKTMNIVSTISLIYKRVVLGVVIIFMLCISLFDIGMLKQTIEARNYIDTTAQFVEIKEDEENSAFNEALYSFTDKNGQNQIIYVSVSSSRPADEIKIKYDENNPQEFYEENQLLGKGGIIGAVVKFIIIALLIVLFFNKNLLSKIHITASRG